MPNTPGNSFSKPPSASSQIAAAIGRKQPVRFAEIEVEKQIFIDHAAVRLVKLGAGISRNHRSVVSQMAEIVVPRGLFAMILMLIARLGASPPPA